MNKLLAFIVLSLSIIGYAAVCPSPNELKRLLAPWQDIPFSKKPEDFFTLQWVRAQILYRNAGVTCTYHNVQEEPYVIWWNSPFIKATYPFIWKNDEQSSFICNRDIETCSFEDF